MGEFLSLLSAFAFALVAIITRRARGGVDVADGYVVSLLANVVGNIGLLSGRLILGGPLGFDPRGLLFYAIAALFGPLLGRYLWFRSIWEIGPSRAGTLRLAAPVFTIVIALALLGERLTPGAWVGVVAVLAGIWFLQSDEGTESEPGKPEGIGPAERGSMTAGFAIALTSGVSFSFANVFRKLGVAQWGEPVIGAFVSPLIALTCFGGLRLLRARSAGRGLPLLRRPALRPYVWAGLLSSIGQVTVIGAMAYNPVSLVNVLTSTETLFTLCLSRLLLRGDERFGLRTWVSALLVSAGVIGITLAG